MGSRFAYQTIQLTHRPPAYAGESTRGQAVGAGVKLLHKASVALNRWAVSYRVNKELEAMSDDLDRMIDKYEQDASRSKAETGVLVVVGIQEWSVPDATGTRAQMFLSIHTGGVGRDPAAIVKEYLSTPSLIVGPADGWRRRNEYLWVTRQH